MRHGATAPSVGVTDGLEADGGWAVISGCRFLPLRRGLGLDGGIQRRPPRGEVLRDRLPSKLTLDAERFRTREPAHAAPTAPPGGRRTFSAKPCLSMHAYAFSSSTPVRCCGWILSRTPMRAAIIGKGRNLLIQPAHQTRVFFCCSRSARARDARAMREGADLVGCEDSFPDTYDVREKLGDGGTAQVWAAAHT